MLRKNSNVLERVIDIEAQEPNKSFVMLQTPSESLSSSHKPAILFGINLSPLPATLQYLILIGGLILFMCLYGYFQELVIYGWFDRKLSMFSTFLHFLGCSFFAQLQRNLMSTQGNRAIPANNSHIHPSTMTSWTQIRGYLMHWFTSSMGIASPHIALFYYLVLVLMKTSSQGLSNLSMSQISYPAKVLFKSANPIITMIIGVIWFRKTYKWHDFLVVFLLILGLYVFITDHHDGNHAAISSTTPMGIVYVVLSMLGSAGVPMLQEHCIITYHASVEDLLYFNFLGSTIISFFLSIITGEFFVGISFLCQSTSLMTWISFFAFCTFGFIGANFSTTITAQYGALVNGISNTFRKAVTIGLSFVLFPERNQLNVQKIVGTLIFFLGLILRIVMKDQHHSHHSSHHSHHKPTNMMISSPQKKKKDDDDNVYDINDVSDVNNVKEEEEMLLIPKESNVILPLPSSSGHLTPLGGNITTERGKSPSHLLNLMQEMDPEEEETPLLTSSSSSSSSSELSTLTDTSSVLLPSSPSKQSMKLISSERLKHIEDPETMLIKDEETLQMTNKSLKTQIIYRNSGGSTLNPRNNILQL